MFPVVPPILELSAATTAAASGRGTRIQTISSDEEDVDVDEEGDEEEILRISIEILVPTKPRNWASAAVRYVRAVRGSRGVSFLVWELAWGWDILFST